MQTLSPSGEIAAFQDVDQFGQDLLSTMLTAHDRLYLDDHSYVRTISIPTHGISGTAFALSKLQSQLLYQSGWTAAEQFFHTWNFAAYQQTYRNVSHPARTPENRLSYLHLAMHKDSPPTHTSW